MLGEVIIILFVLYISVLVIEFSFFFVCPAESLLLSIRAWQCSRWSNYCTFCALCCEGSVGGYLFSLSVLECILFTFI